MKKNLLKTTFVTLFCLVCCTSCSSLKSNLYWCGGAFNAVVGHNYYFRLPDTFKLFGHTYKKQETNTDHGELIFFGYVYNKATYEEMKDEDESLAVAIDHKNSMCRYDCGGYYDQSEPNYNVRRKIYRVSSVPNKDMYKEIYIGDTLYT